jgi:hypothetical protein
MIIVYLVSFHIKQILEKLISSRAIIFIVSLVFSVQESISYIK